MNNLCCFPTPDVYFTGTISPWLSYQRLSERRSGCSFGVHALRNICRNSQLLKGETQSFPEVSPPQIGDLQYEVSLPLTQNIFLLFTIYTMETSQQAMPSILPQEEFGILTSSKQINSPPAGNNHLDTLQVTQTNRIKPKCFTHHPPSRSTSWALHFRM